MVGFSNPHREMLLPPAAMPWGRWVEGGIQQNAETTNLIKSEQDIAQGLFNARADSLTDQIYAVEGLANIDTYELPEFTRSFPGYSGNFLTQHVHSPDYVISANRSPSNGFLFVNVHAQWVSGADPEKLHQAYPSLTLVGAEPITAISTQQGTPIDPNNLYAWVETRTNNSFPRGTTASYTVRFSLSSNYFGTTANPLTVKFTGCKIGFVEIGTLQ